MYVSLTKLLKKKEVVSEFKHAERQTDTGFQNNRLSRETTGPTKI
jgi:hypothetical protein